MVFPDHDGPKVTDGRKDGHSKLVYDKESRTIVQQRETMTADQQIRAEALKCFTQMYAGYFSIDDTNELWRVQHFERYIREGK